MKFLFSIALIFAFALPGFSQSANSEWKNYQSAEYLFKADFPGTPKTETNTIDAKAGKRYPHWFIVEGNGKFYGVSITDFQSLPLMLKREELTKNYDAVQDSFVKASNYKLIGERDIMTGEDFGREITLSTGSEIAVARMFLVRQRLYQAITTMNNSLAKDEKSQKDAKTFLDSFQIIEPENRK